MARVTRARSSAHGRRLLLVVLVTLMVGGIAAVTARADSGDVNVAGANNGGQHPYQTGTATVNADGTVTVDVTGGWSWPTHGHDCNTDRAGTGIAVNWFDPKDRGFHVAYFDLDFSGTTNTTAGGPDDFGVGSTGAGGRNPVDNVVHPTENDVGPVATVTKKARTLTTVTLTAANAFVVGDSITVAIGDANYDGTFTISARTATTISYAKSSATTQNATNTTGTVTDGNSSLGAVVDITSPAQWASWRGGCGVFSNSTILVNRTPPPTFTTGAVAHGNFGRATPSSTDVSGAPFTNPVPPSLPSRRGALLRHTYASTDDLTKLCALTYDVHSGTPAAANNGVGITKAASEVTAGDQAVAAGTKYTSIHNTDNSIQSNGGTPGGNTCPAFFFPHLSTTATGGQFNASGSVTVSDSITVSGADPGGTGSISAKLWNSACTTVIDSKSIALKSGPAGTVNDTYSWSSTAVTAAGDYKFSADLIVGGQTIASEACGAHAAETATVTKRPTDLTTDAGGPYAPTNSLTDTATLSSGTSDATGSITFKLFADDGSGGCGTQIGSDQVVPVNGMGQYQATVTDPAIGPGATGNATFHWTASYSGDDKNATSSQGCGANKENPVILFPHIDVDKGPNSQTIESANNGELTPPAGTTPGLASFSITVKNDGNVTLTNVHVTDAQAPGCARSAADIAADPNAPHSGTATFNVNDTYTYTCSKSGLTAGFTNSATSTGTAGNTDVSDTDTADVTVIHPHIQVTKRTPNGGATESVPIGGTANFTITVTNDGDVALTDVIVSDANVQGCAATSDGRTIGGNATQAVPGLASMATSGPTSTVTYTCSFSPVTATFTNAVQACGTDPLTGVVCDNDGTTGNPTTDCTTAGGNSADQCVTILIETLTTDQDFKPKDTAHLSGLSNTPNGSLTFTLYKDDAGMKQCTSTHSIYSDTVTVNANGDYSTTSASFLSALNLAKFGSSGTAGNYNWQVSYSGDTHGNADIVGACGTENFQVSNG